jgi:phage gpG-like protein
LAETFTSYEVDNDLAFQKALDRTKNKVGDLTIPLILIAKDFYKSEQAIFKLKGPGQYPDLADETKEQKVRQVGFVYPILKRSGRLEGSVTKGEHPDAINQIVNKDTLIIGTSVPYGIFHQSDAPRSKIPLRKFLFIGPESSFALSPQKGRLERWTKTLEAFAFEAADSEIGEGSS